MSQQDSKSFGKESDAFLQAVYQSVAAETAQQKIAFLALKLNGEPNFYSVGGEVSLETKLACLEYEYLETLGLVNSEL